MVTVPCHAVAARDRVIICSNAARRGCQTTLTTTTTYHYMAASVAAKPRAAGCTCCVAPRAVVANLALLSCRVQLRCYIHFA
ncbi:hypothetical protein SRHO_G00338740 [Serrasalmus rhombeus]